MGFVDYTGKRLLLALGQLLAASFVIFLIVRLVPGNPAELILGTGATEAAIQDLQERLGLTGPLLEQYVSWLGDAILLNWGDSLTSGQSIQALVTQTYPRSLVLAAFGLLFAVLIAFPLAILAAEHHRTKWDNVAVFFSQIGISIPSFLVGIVLLLVFARYLQILPASGYVPITQDPIGGLTHIFLPALTLGIVIAAVTTRYLRSEMIEELGKSYVQTAKAFGHPRRRIVLKYAFRNALIPVVTSLGVSLGYMIGGVVIIEQVFAFPGLGRLVLSATLARNYPLVQIGLLLLVGTFIVVNFVVDLLYALLNPKIRY